MSREKKISWIMTYLPRVRASGAIHKGIEREACACQSLGTHGRAHLSEETHMDRIVEDKGCY